MVPGCRSGSVFATYAFLASQAFGQKEEIHEDAAPCDEDISIVRARLGNQLSLPPCPDPDGRAIAYAPGGSNPSRHPGEPNYDWFGTCDDGSCLAGWRCSSTRRPGPSLHTPPNPSDLVPHYSRTHDSPR